MSVEPADGPLTHATADQHRRLSRAIVLVRAISGPTNLALERRVGVDLARNTSISVLSHIAIFGPARPRELQASTQLTSGGLSNLLGRLEQADLIARSDMAERDGRGVLVALTERGRDVESTIGQLVVTTLRVSTALIDELHEVTVALAGTTSPVPRRRPGRAQSRVSFDLTTLGISLTSALAHELGEHSVDRAAATVLASINPDEHARPRDLGELLGLTTGGVSRLLDRLDSLGLVRRERGILPDDRRAIAVSLTEQGESAQAAILDQLVPLIPRFERAFTFVRRDLGRLR